MSYIDRLGPVGTVKWEVRGTMVNPPSFLIGLAGLCLLSPFSSCWYAIVPSARRCDQRL